MEAVSLEMDDIFGGDMQDEDVDQLPQMLPDLPDAEGSGNDGHGAQNEGDIENRKLQDKIKGMKGASKNTIKRPQPKLDGIRLTGERGIPILPRIFKDVKLKGKGHEVDDLRVVMRYLEHWAHRLFPKMPFDEVLERIERLGTKRDVQTCIKKMRLDMPVLGSDTVIRGDDDAVSDDDEDDDRAHKQQPDKAPSAEELFDALVQEEQELEAELNGTSSPESRRKRPEAARTSPNVSRQNSGAVSNTNSPAQSSQSSSSAAGNTGLSSEILERMERNRRLAMEKRAKKLGVSVASLSQPQQGNTSTQPSTSRGSQDSTAQPSRQTDTVTESAATSDQSKGLEETPKDQDQEMEDNSSPV